MKMDERKPISKERAEDRALRRMLP